MSTKYKQYELSPIQHELTEIKILTGNTIEKIIERGDKLDKLVDNTAGLQESSKLFYKKTKGLKNKLMYNRIKCMIFTSLIVGSFLYLFLVAICGKFDISKC